VLSLPSKPWKKIRIDALAEHRWRIAFLSDFADEAQFRRTVEDDVRPCLGATDEVIDIDGAARAVVVATRDLVAFKRNLVFACIMVEFP